MNRDREANRRRADTLRAIPLATVLTYRGAERDRSDRAKWHTERGPISVTGEKFWNWTLQRGGGGAIDLVMHLADTSYGPACQWLEQHLGTRGTCFQPANRGVGFQPAEPVRKPPWGEADRRCPRPASVATNDLDGDRSSRRLLLPPRDDRRLPRVRAYLERQRGLPSYLLDPLIASGKLYADSRSNAVFLLVSGRAEQPVGAELRGTGPRTGLANDQFR
jgi:hypothetical protein